MGRVLIVCGTVWAIGIMFAATSPCRPGPYSGYCSPEELAKRSAGFEYEELQ